MLLLVELTNLSLCLCINFTFSWPRSTKISLIHHFGSSDHGCSPETFYLSMLLYVLICDLDPLFHVSLHKVERDFIIFVQR